MRDVSTGRARPHPKVGARRPHPEVAGSEATSEPTAIYRGGLLLFGQLQCRPQMKPRAPVTCGKPTSLAPGVGLAQFSKCTVHTSALHLAGSPTGDSYAFRTTQTACMRDKRDDQHWRSPSRTFSWSAYDESPARCWRPSIRLERAHQAPDQGRRAPIANRVRMGPRQLSCYRSPDPRILSRRRRMWSRGGRTRRPDVGRRLSPQLG